MDEAAAWIRAHVEPTGPPEVVRDRTWATTARVPVADGCVWFKACSPLQRFEPRLVAFLAERHGDALPEVIAHEPERAWLLLRDAGTPFDELGNPPELWLRLLPRYAELQRDEAGRIPDGVPDRTLATLPGRYAELAEADLPLDAGERARLRAFGPRFAELCAELAAFGLPETIQHDDLHHKNAFVDGDALRIIDWGDASVSHPFFSLVVTFRFLEERTGLAADDPWFARLRDAYLEPWGRGLQEAFALSQRVGRFAHTVGWLALRPHLPADDVARYDEPFAIVLRRALAFNQL